jgi:hypothetical protein
MRVSIATDFRSLLVTLEHLHGPELRVIFLLRYFWIVFLAIAKWFCLWSELALVSIVADAAAGLV